MASLELRNVSDEVMEELSARARQLHRPIEEEATETLSKAVLSASRPRKCRLSIDEQLSRLKVLHEQQRGVWLTKEFIDAAINQGRP
ncbi:MAG TPA: hypothetical protein VHY37_08390 [Tepidisphaeraceae bacterium]|jgi:plasmid stability protein|nr:hypothetical protein [Tepidisphaeraceae bacterium]